MFLRYFLTFANSQPNISYKNVSYKKRVLQCMTYTAVSNHSNLVVYLLNKTFLTMVEKIVTTDSYSRIRQKS